MTVKLTVKYRNVTSKMLFILGLCCIIIDR